MADFPGEAKALTTALVRWARLILWALVLAIFGSFLAAWMSEPPDGPRRIDGKNSLVVNVGGEGRDSPPPLLPRVESYPPGVVLHLDVNAVAGPPADELPDGPGNDGGGTTQTVNIQSAQVPVQPQAATSARDLVVVLDRAKRVVGPPGAENGPGGPRVPKLPLCSSRDHPSGGAQPCATAELLGRVRFEAGGRRIHSVSSEPDRIEEIVDKLNGRAGTLLVIGHADGCGPSKLAGRRAKTALKAVRRLMKCRAEWRDGRIQIHAQAAGDDQGAPEKDCTESNYGTAGVYLIEGLQ